MLDRLTMKFIATCRRRRWGKKLEDGTWVDIILFADNYWLVATNHKMLEKHDKGLAVDPRGIWVGNPDGRAHVVYHPGGRRRSANRDRGEAHVKDRGK